VEEEDLGHVDAEEVVGGGAEEEAASGGAEEEGDGDGDFSLFLRGKQKRSQPLETVDFTDLSTYAT
jgi:hypothetical protein